MALVQRNLPITDWAVGTLSAPSPSDVYDISKRTNVNILTYENGSYRDILYFKFQALPSSLAYNAIRDVSIRLRYEGGSIGYKSGTAEILYDHRGRPGVKPISSSFSSSTLTWANKPSLVDGGFSCYLRGGSYPDIAYDYTLALINADSLSDAEKSQYCSLFLKNNAFGLFCDRDGFPSGYGDRWIGVRRKIGANEDGTPYLTVTYDDSIIVKSQVASTSAPSGTSVDPRVAQSFAWDLSRKNTETYYCAGTFVQSSARVYWRVQGTSSWNSLSASGSTKSLSAPANTFPSNKTIEWYISCTDTAGTTSTTSTATFKTLPTTITPTTFPSGSNIDTRSAKTFAWTLTNSQGTVNQKSAKLYWRVTGASSYNVINNATSTKSISVPANTFPTGSNIQWYLEVVDSSNGVSTTNVATFTTVSPKITPTTYPSGSAVYTASAITFTWEFQSAVGNYNQRSAKLYWRSSSSQAYTSILASGSTKSLTVPANTFPTAATIQWYLEGVDVGGLTSTSSTATFTTVTPTITATQFPSGSNVDTRLATVIKWEFRSASGNYSQKSATFYWRVSGAATYNSIAASGTTQQVTVPANTFPTASTIQWYIAGVDSSNHSSQTSPATFTTVTPQIVATEYPTGSNVFSGEDITFKWKFESAAGDYTQKSAVFYWRASTTESYQAINAQGTSQQVIVPANTFPTNKTVYWYVSGVDSSNHSSQTSVTSFTTQTTQITVQGSPTSGYSDPREAIVFQWYFAAEGGSVPQSSATFYWKLSTEENYTSVSASGSTARVAIPANTFPVASIIDWYVTGTDVGGTSSTSEVYSFSTTAAAAYAIVKHPINSGVDGAAPITFSWSLVTADGRAPSRVILQWKLPIESEQYWHNIVDTNSAITSYTVEERYFNAGEINWRVCAYNVDGIAGPFSTASFICIIAPSITALTASAVPFSTVSWQTADQEGYQLEVDGKGYGPYYSTEKQFAIPDYLRDGVHTIKLRILGAVDMWSGWSETTVSIQNVPKDEIDVQGYANTNVKLDWQTESASADFYIYRDDILIGHTNKTEFTDRYSLGWHNYYVVNRYEDGNYDISVTLSRKTCVEYMYLWEIDGTVDLNIKNYKKNTEPSYQSTRQVTLNHQAGHRYPSAFKSEFYDTSISCSAIFLYTDEESRKKFISLLGKAVVVKIKDGTCCTAVIDNWSWSAKKTYYTEYTFTLTQIDWEDYVDDTQ